MTAEWPVDLRGVTESVVTTPGPDGRYNVAALGVYAPDERANKADATARTWGRTRTRRNFTERGAGYIQFLRDPVVFVDAALGVREEEHPVLDCAHAWVEIRPERIDTGTEGGTEWVDWRLVPREQAVRERVVPAFNRGYAAVIEATVAVSRLDVPDYDTDRLRERIDTCERVARRCGGPEEHAAFERIRDIVDEIHEGKNRSGESESDAEGAQ
jgi:hypothetical protein